MSDLRFSKDVLVTHQDLDLNNHVNNVKYVQWVEEMAKAHWELLKSKTPYQNDFWMLVDHHIRYIKQVYLNQVVTIITYPEKPIGVKQPRKVEFYCNGELVVESTTQWILIDQKSKKIKRIQQDWIERFLLGADHNE